MSGPGKPTTAKHQEPDLNSCFLQQALWGPYKPVQQQRESVNNWRSSYEGVQPLSPVHPWEPRMLHCPRLQAASTLISHKPTLIPYPATLALLCSLQGESAAALVLIRRRNLEVGAYLCAPTCCSLLVVSPKPLSNFLARFFKHGTLAI